jgi:hypothetical protein
VEVLRESLARNPRHSTSPVQKIFFDDKATPSSQVLDRVHRRQEVASCAVGLCQGLFFEAAAPGREFLLHLSDGSRGQDSFGSAKR